MTSLWAALPWAAPFFTIPTLARTTPTLLGATPARGKLMSVIIPARDEAETIATVVGSVLASTYEPLEVIVVDDGSTDGTGAIVQGLAADDQRLRLIQGGVLPPGWFGKPVMSTTNMPSLMVSSRSSTKTKVLAGPGSTISDNLR